MSTFWVELHCEGHTSVSGCFSAINDHPGILVSSVSQASRFLYAEAKEKRWGFKRSLVGWLCPNCIKAYNKGWRP